MNHRHNPQVLLDPLNMFMITMRRTLPTCHNITPYNPAARMTLPSNAEQREDLNPAHIAKLLIEKKLCSDITIHQQKNI